ncbi:MAG: phosphoadenosine phosphosulfate reductase [Cyanobacteria bacterium J06621_11]
MVQCIEAPTAKIISASDNSTSDNLLESVQSAHKSEQGTKFAQNTRELRQFVAQLDLTKLNQHFASATPQDILAWCICNLPQGLVQTSSFSLLAVTHMLYKELNHPVPVIFLDTLHLFPETLETAKQATAHYNLNLHTYRAVEADSADSFASRYGERLWETDIEKFYALTKIEPLQRALKDLDAVAWITGRRRDQSGARQDLPIFERDEQGRLKINPLAHWTKKDIWAYIFKHDVPYNPLHDQGYTSIGDQPLTTPTIAGEEERAGRWRGTEKTECGIHL